MTQQLTTFHPRDAVTETAFVTAVTGTAGLTLAAVENALRKENIGARGVFTRSGGTIVSFVAVGAAFAFTNAASSNLREKRDHWNATIGGFFGGAAAGLRSRSISNVIGLAAAGAVAVGVFAYTGATPRGRLEDPNRDMLAEKEALKKRRRRPIQEIVDELGEYRGIAAPGYQERRKARIKEKYGFEITPPIKEY